MRMSGTKRKSFTLEEKRGLINRYDARTYGVTQTDFATAQGM